MGETLDENKKGIGEIKKRLAQTDVEKIPELLALYREDQRMGVKKLVAAFEKKYEFYQKELVRLDTISSYEKQHYAEGYHVIAGIDEVGRGPLAGPVAAGVVIFEKGCMIPGITDSKKLSAEKREELYEKIIESALDYQVVFISPEEIDRINILQATYEAMRQAVNKLKLKPDFILVDGHSIPSMNIPQLGIIKGDDKSISIGAASILAKVTRDRMMKEYDKLYPGYGFSHNMGYGSKEHMEQIKANGLCPIHRRSFVKNLFS